MKKIKVNFYKSIEWYDDELDEWYEIPGIREKTMTFHFWWTYRLYARFFDKHLFHGIKNYDLENCRLK